MKRTLSLLLVSALSLFGLGCSAVTPGPKYAIIPKTYPFRLHLDPAAEKTTEEITLYFINGGDIPYVALHEYMPFVGRIYKEDGIGPAAAEKKYRGAGDNPDGRTHPRDAHAADQNRRRVRLV